MKTQRCASLFSCAVFLLAYAGTVFAWSGRPVAVADDAVLTVSRGAKRVQIHLYGILAPMPGSSAAAETKRFLVLLMREREVIVEDTDNAADGSNIYCIFNIYC